MKMEQNPTSDFQQLHNVDSTSVPDVETMLHNVKTTLHHVDTTLFQPIVDVC